MILPARTLSSSLPCALSPLSPPIHRHASTGQRSNAPDAGSLHGPTRVELVLDHAVAHRVLDAADGMLHAVKNPASPGSSRYICGSGQPQTLLRAIVAAYERHWRLLVSSASAIRLSLQPSPGSDTSASNRMRAFVKSCAERLPLPIISSSCPRFSALSRTTCS
jgi:hypothetical protein